MRRMEHRQPDIGRVGMTAVVWLNGTAAVEEYYNVRGIKWVSRAPLRLSTSIRKAISHVWDQKPVRDGVATPGCRYPEIDLTQDPCPRWAMPTDEQVWEYILELAPILAFDDQLSKDEKDHLIESFRIRFARPWSTATDEEIWEYILEVNPLIVVHGNLDEDEVASLIESYRAHGAPRDVPAGAIMEIQVQMNNADIVAIVTRVAVNTAVAEMNRPAGPITTPADLVARIEDGVVRVAGGSGFIFDVDGETAFVATNHHVIDGMRNVEVVVKNYETYEALVLGWDVERDVAVLSICCSREFIALPWDPSESEIGDSVVAVGYPQGGGLGVTATVGETSESDVLSSTYGLIPHTAPLKPGNSGGPLFSMPDGKVLGINTAKGTESLRFYAVPFQTIERQVAQWRSQLVVPR